MTLKQFSWVRVAVAFILAFVVAQAIILDSYILASVAVLIAAMLVILLRRQVKEVLADERDYKIAGDIARWTLAIFAIAGWLFSFILIALRNIKPEYEAAGFTLAFAVCAILVIHLIVGLVFRRVHDGISKKAKTAYFILAFLIALLAIIAGARIFSGEDDWICQNGQWVEHGKPSAPMPAVPCKQ